MLLRHTLACTMALGLCTVSTGVTAGSVQVGVRTFAADAPSGLSFSADTDGNPSCCIPAASRTVTTVVGNATATSMAQADSLTGTVKDKLSAKVTASDSVIGRNSGGPSSASMEGGIHLSGPSPGMATFAGVLEGTDPIGTRLFAAPDKSARIQYYVSISNSSDSSSASSAFQDDLYFTDFGPGTFNIPFSWTKMVSPGDVMHFDLYLRTDVSAVAGLVDFDATNTFKITDIDLPSGYSFTPDATGFLSQFGAPPIIVVPPNAVPGSVTLLPIGLAGMLALVARRQGRAGRCHGGACTGPVRSFV